MRSSLGTDYRAVRAGQTEEAIRRIVRLIRPLLERINGSRIGLMEATASVQSKAERGFKYALLAPAVIWVIALTFFPILAAVHYSFANYVLGEGITGYVGFDNYARLLTDSGFWYSIFITAPQCRNHGADRGLCRLYPGLVNYHWPPRKEFFPAGTHCSAVHDGGCYRVPRCHTFYRPRWFGQRTAWGIRDPDSVAFHRGRRASCGDDFGFLDLDFVLGFDV